MVSALQTQLINAIQDDERHIIMSILTLGIDLTQTEDYAPLALAAIHSSKKVFFALLLSGADLFAYTPRQGNSPLSPLSWLVTGERKDIFRILFKLGYLDVHKHHNHLERALAEQEEKEISRAMRRFFINHGFQGSSFMPAYACAVYDYEDEPMECADVSVFQPYIEKKKKIRIDHNPTPRRQTRSFGSSNLLK